MENVVICGESVIVKKKPKYICIHDGCDKRSIYNFIGKSRPQYRGGHKEPEMVNVNVYSTIGTTRCQKQPFFVVPK